MADSCTAMRNSLSTAKFLRMKARGLSMYPFIRESDTVIVKSTNAVELRAGDVALYRSDAGAVIAHRFLGAVTEPTGITLRMRADSRSAPVEYVEPEHVLGKVVAVQRGGRIFAMDTWLWRLAGLIWSRVNPVGHYLGPTGELPRKLAAGLLSLVQCSKGYRQLAGKLIGRRVRYRIASDEERNELIAGLGYRTAAGPASGAEPPMTGGPDRRLLVASLGAKIVGWLHLEQAPADLETEGQWIIGGLSVRTPYRGAGIGRGLLIMAGTTLGELGADRLLGLTFHTNTRVLALADHVGADRPLMSQLNPETRTSHATHESVLLARTLEEGLRAVHEQGILEKYRGTGCCDAWLQAHAGVAPTKSADRP